MKQMYDIKEFHIGDLVLINGPYKYIEDNEFWCGEYARLLNEKIYKIENTNLYNKRVFIDCDPDVGYCLWVYYKYIIKI